MTARELMTWWGPVRYFVDEFGCLWMQNQNGYWWWNGVFECLRGPLPPVPDWRPFVADWRPLEGNLPPLDECEPGRAEATIQLFLDDYQRAAREE